MPVSAGIYVRTFDFSPYARKLGRTALALLGGASKGPVNVPTRISNESDLVRTFGKPLLNDYGLHAAVAYLKKADNLVYTRVTHGAVQASYSVSGTSAGSGAVKATGTVVFAGNVNPDNGNSITLASSIPTIALENDANGAVGNTAITVVGAFATSGAFASGSATSRAVATLRLSVLPTDGDTVAISDGTTARVFEFRTAGPATGSNVLVLKGADVFTAAAALVATITADAFNVSATNTTVTKTFEFDSDHVYASGAVPVLIGATAVETLANLMSAVALNRAILGISVRNTTSTLVPQATFTNETAGVRGNSPILKTGAAILVTGFSGGVDAGAGSISQPLNVYARNPGTWGNALQIAVQPTQVIGASPTNFDLYVYAPVDDGSSLSLVERFFNLSLSAASDRFAETLINTGKRGEVTPSEYVTVDVTSDGVLTPSAVDPVTGALITYMLGQSPGIAGTDGIAGLGADDYIGTVAGQTSTGLQALRNPETLEFNLLAIPGVSDKDVINAALRIANQRGDFFYLIDLPFGLSRDQAVLWHNGSLLSVPGAPVAPIDDRLCAVFGTWYEADDTYSKKTIWLPPCGGVAADMAASDETSPYVAVAGSVRGCIESAISVEYSPTAQDRDVLCAGQNRINPLVNFANGGVTIYGNRTTQRRATALDSIHIVRMLITAQKLCATAVRALEFNPNDPDTWREYESLCNRELSAVQAGRGIEVFKVICDATTNPPAQRQNKTMRGKLLIRPIDAAEIIQLDFAVFATGATFTTNF